MKTIFSILLLFILSNLVIAQNKIDVIQFKDGTILKGVITEQTPPSMLKIRLSDGKIYKYKYEEIEKISIEESIDNERETATQCKKQNNPNKYLFRRSGHKIIVEQPKHIDYATELAVFFDAFIFVNTFSFVKVGAERYLYMHIDMGRGKDYSEITENDSVHFYFSNQKVIKLPPLTKYQDDYGQMIAFYKLERTFIDTMSIVDLDSIRVNFTPHYDNPSSSTDKLPKFFTYRNFPEKVLRRFKRSALCFKKEY